MKVTISNDTDISVTLQEKTWGVVTSAAIFCCEEVTRWLSDYRFAAIVDNLVQVYIEKSDLVGSKTITLEWSSAGDMIIA